MSSIVCPSRCLAAQHGFSPVAAQAAHGYTGTMRALVLLAVLPLAACSLPGRETLAPNPVAPQASEIAATDAFTGRIPLVTIQPGTTDFAAPLKSAVAQALAIKPQAAFEVTAQAPQGIAPDDAVTFLQNLAPLASIVAQSIRADGVAADRVTLAARTGGQAPVILVYVK
ncbi:hypothetical protein [Acidocella aromatica]|uniref:Uncharacterized protein n=1 Tax=Acidocella aromatica TaxID=1303579 RepID=A0A840VR77_9PROT|nr:hypothetical protein [Acidocella aromatica]MBB5372792.1 hypothetical protein [Acidocella aromatica]